MDMLMSPASEHLTARPLSALRKLPELRRLHYNTPGCMEPQPKLSWLQSHMLPECQRGPPFWSSQCSNGLVSWSLLHSLSIIRKLQGCTISPISDSGPPPEPLPLCSSPDC